MPQTIIQASYSDEIMLVRLEERKMATILEALVKHVFQVVGNTSYNDLGDFREVFRGSVIWIMLRHPL